MKKVLYFMLLSLALHAQTYQWKWAKQGGGDGGSLSSTFDIWQDEHIRDVAVDNNNNYYFLTNIYGGALNSNNPALDGSPVIHYGGTYDDSDLLLFSTDCLGNVRWTRTIGGTGNEELAWKIQIDTTAGFI